MPTPLQARVNGAGPTGALTAVALADAGWQVSLRDRLDAHQLLERRRAYALTHSSRELLERLGLWGGLSGRLQPFRQLRLIDRWLDRQVAFDPEDLGDGTAAVGWIVDHRDLMELLLERIRVTDGIALELAAADRPPSPADGVLVVAADGPASGARQAEGIGWWGWRYRQGCLAAQVELRGSAATEAWEILRPEGPFAVLPLGERRFQIVWSAPLERCRRREAMEPAAFLDLLAGVLPDPLQPDALLDRPRAFPVELRLASRLHRGRTVLVGESAHRCHPVGGQGLNLCWRDVAELHRLACRAAAGRLPPRRIGAAYGRRRRPDLLLTLLATDLLTRTFSNRLPPLAPPRRLGLALLAGVPWLRRRVLATMTHGPCRPPARPVG
jgi:2-octaprenyl-6-methoxyphenol hydroxylase